MKANQLAELTQMVIKKYGGDTEIEIGYVHDEGFDCNDSAKKYFIFQNGDKKTMIISEESYGGTLYEPNLEMIEKGDL